MSKKSYLSIVLLILVWTEFYIATKFAVGSLSVFVAGAWVRFFTFSALTIIMWAKGEISSLLHIKGIWKRLIIIGVLGFLVDLTAFYGFQLSSVSNGTILLKADILMANLITIVFFKQKFTVFDWLYSSGMLTGVFLVLNVDILSFRLNGIGDLLFILSALFITLNAFVIQSVQKRCSVPGTNNLIAYYNNLVVLILFTASSLLMGQPSLAADKLMQPGILTAVLATAFGQTVVYILYYSNLKKHPVWIIKTVLLIVPVLSAVIGCTFLNEIMTWKRAAGMLIVLGGAVGIIYEQQRKKKPDRRYRRSWN